ncbi:hypothetical protein FH588_20775 [Leptospira interrogans]|uniref:hypothetical protein n=1 Tax=Leptospira interrogans TaxID=173 RepID=UPI001F4D2C59|nr:hypothetical protein [Leptospira interrogans]UNE66910.1 hypothetical protein FH588_20775 [Leptospira interrogans]
MGFCVGLVNLNDTKTDIETHELSDDFISLVGSLDLFEIICEFPHQEIKIDDGLWIKRPLETSFSQIKEKVKQMDSNVVSWLQFISIIENDPVVWMDWG